MGCGEVEGAGGESGGEESHVCHHFLSVYSPTNFGC